MTRRSTARQGRSAPRRAWRGLGGLVVALVMMAAVPAVAGAQVPEPPPLPDIPEVPQPVRDASDEIGFLINPILNQAATEAGPAANAAGFVLRPVCAGVGTVIFAVSLTGVLVPVFPMLSPYLGPASIVCVAAYQAGPADDVFEEVDAALAPTWEAEVDPVVRDVTAEISSNMGPVRQELQEVCDAVRLFTAPTEHTPPPANRVQPVMLVCLL